MIDNSQRVIVFALHSKGRSEEVISKATGLTIPQVDKLLREAGLK